MSANPWIYILVMAAVTYLIRALPLTLIRREIRNPFLRSFLYYVPYVTLTAMTIPAIFSATANPLSASVGLAAALGLAYWGKSLLTTAASACLAVFAVEFLQKIL